MFRFLVKDFSRDHRCVAYNLAGTGATDPSLFHKEKYQTLEGYADDAIAICDELGLGDVTHVGHSVSAMIAIIAARKRPELFKSIVLIELFKSIVLIGPSPRYINDANYYGGFSEEDIEELLEVMNHNYQGWAKQMGPAIMGNQERPALGEELTQRFCEVDPDIAKFFARVTFTSDNRNDLATVNHRCLILQCDEDIIAPEPVGRYVHEKIPDSIFEMLEARGHCPNLSEPEQTISAIRRFIEPAN